MHENKKHLTNGQFISANGTLYHYKDGEFHNEIGPAVITQDDIICEGYKDYFYKGRHYGRNNFTNETWIEKVKEIKYLESLEIFK